MTPRPRKKLDPKSPPAGSTEFTIRFALHLRGLVDRAKLTQTGFWQKLQENDLDVAEVTIRKWLSGARLPRVGDLEQIARALGVKDYRDVLPPARK